MRIVSILHSALYGLPALCFIVVFFIFINLKTGFVGIRKAKAAAKTVFNRKKGSSGGASPLKSAFVALSATVGTGNIVGVAGAVTLGGPGAVFWMWVSALLALSVKFCEIYLSKSGAGAFGYVRFSLGEKALRVFCLFGLLTAAGVGNVTQSNAAAQSAAMLLSRAGVPEKNVLYITGICFSLLGFYLLRRRIAFRFCEKILPLMAAGYIILCLAALFFARRELPRVFCRIFHGAFDPAAVTGGAVGSVFLSVKAGTARGIFSNEAGLGVSALAYEKSGGDAEEIALFGIFEVFIDTMVLCTLTALVVLSSGIRGYGADAGALTALFAFRRLLGEKALFFFCPAIIIFAFSSLVGWGIYAVRFAETAGLFGAAVPFAYCALSLYGAAGSADTVWQIAEICTLFMMTVNFAAIFAGRKKIAAGKFRAGRAGRLTLRRFDYIIKGKKNL